MKALMLILFLLVVSVASAADPVASDSPSPDSPTIMVNPIVIDPTRCDYGVELDPSLRGILDNFVTRCDDRVEAALNVTNLDDRLKSFKESVCTCYNTERPQNLDDLNLQGLNETTRRRVRSDLTGNSVVSTAAINENIKTQNILLNEQRNGVMIQASILSPDPRERDALTNAYSGRDAFDRMIDGAQKGLARATENLPGRENIDQTFAAPKFDDSALSDGDTCPSMREFRHFRQFPEDNEFYQDLLSPRNSSYREDDWNFEKLKEQLSVVSSSKRILSLDSAKADRDTAWIIRRMDFLMRNPLLKNFFQQRGISQRKRQHLYNLVQQSFRPIEGPQSCLNTPGACQGAAALRSGIYQTGLREFFRDPDNVRRVVSLDVDSMERTLSSLPQRVTTTPVIPTAGDLSSLSPWMDRIMGRNVHDGTFFNSAGLSVIRNLGTQTANTLSLTNTAVNGNELPTGNGVCANGNCNLSSIGTINLQAGFHSRSGTNADASANADIEASEAFHRTLRLSEINQTCNMLSDTNLNGHGFIMSQLEKEWSRELCDPTRPINGQSCVNPALIEMSGKFCSRYKANTTDVISLNQFRSEGGCADTTKSCLSQFLKSTSTILPENEQAAANWTTLFDTAKISNLSGQETAQVEATISRNNNLSESDYVRTAGADVTRDFTPISTSRSGPVSSNQNPGPSTSNASAVSASPSTSLNSVQAAADIIVPTSGSAASGALPQKEVVRSQVRQSETEAQEIREQISTLKDSLIRERENASSLQDSSLISGLTQRLADLESRLEAKDRETARLRRQLARTPSEPPSPSRSVASSDNDDDRNGRVTSPASVQNLAAPQGGQQSGSIQSPVASTGSQSLSPGNNRLSSANPVGRSGPSSVNSVNLSKYGVQSATAQGSITVANPSSSIDYNSLRSQSADSVISLSLSVEDFNNLSANNLESLGPYLDQARSKPGEVVRLAITAQGTQNQMELFVVKNGDQISVIPASGASRGIASEVPAAPQIPSDRARLEQLRLELPGQ